MSWSTVHTITCDSCGWWDDTSQGATKAAATSRAKAAGWLVEPKRKQLCPPCRRIAEMPVDDVEPEPAPEPEAPPIVVSVEPVPDPPPEPVDPPTVEIAAAARVQLAAGGSRRRYTA